MMAVPETVAVKREFLKLSDNIYSVSSILAHFFCSVFAVIISTSIIFCRQKKSCNGGIVLRSTIDSDWIALMVTLVAGEHNALIAIARGYYSKDRIFDSIL